MSITKKNHSFDSVETSLAYKEGFCLTDCLYNSKFNDDIIKDPIYERYQSYYQKFND